MRPIASNISFEMFSVIIKAFEDVAERSCPPEAFVWKNGTMYVDSSISGSNFIKMQYLIFGFEIGYNARKPKENVNLN